LPQIIASTNLNSNPNFSSENSSADHLALHVRRELHRLRRDVSYLQLTRRQQRRQAAEAAAAAAVAAGQGQGGSPIVNANGECQCQPGESKNHY